MVKGSKKRSDKHEAATTEGSNARCLPIAAAGITSSKAFAQFMSSLMSDLVSGSITPQVGNAICNAGGKLLKVVEMELKHGKQNQDGTKSLPLA